MKKTFKINLLVLMLFTLISMQNVKADSAPYSNYKDIEWAGISTGDGIKISNGKLECDNERKLICELTSSIDEPIKKVSAFGYYRESVSLLTENGKVYVYDYNDTINDMEFKQILNDYKIIDMTQEEKDYSFAYHYPVDWDDGWHNSTGHGIFYLTDDEKLINKLGNTYEDVNKDFVHSTCFENYYSSYDYEICLYFSKDNSISYKEETKLSSTESERYSYPKNVDYIEFKNKLGDKLIAKHVYDVIPDFDSAYSRTKILIVDENNDLYEVIFGNNKDKVKLEYIGRITSVQSAGDGAFSINFNLSDTRIYNFYTLNNYYFDVKTHAAPSLEKVNELYKSEFVDSKDNGKNKTGNNIVLYLSFSIILIFGIIFTIRKIKAKQELK